MKQRALLRVAVEHAHAARGPAEIELFVRGGGAAEGVGEDGHGVVVEVCGLLVVSQGHGEGGVGLVAGGEGVDCYCYVGG